MPRTLKLLLAYDGTGLVGWQRQAAGVSVQGLLEDALAAIEGRPVQVDGAGRTDAGVHALGQVASCRLDHPILGDALRRALNARLPDDVRVLDVEEAPQGFHARYSARSKSYRYVLLNADGASPFERRYVWRVAGPLDVDAMAGAAGLIEGERDFAALQGAGSASRTTVRVVTRAAVREVTFEQLSGPFLAPPVRHGAARLVAFEFAGSGFLRHMVRNAVGSLVEIGAGRRTPEWFQAVLATGDRTKAGPTAPAGGLFLVGVDYGSEGGHGGPAPACRQGPRLRDV